jgi:hypothetical protein
MTDKEGMKANVIALRYWEPGSLTRAEEPPGF